MCSLQHFNNSYDVLVLELAAAELPLYVLVVEVGVRLLEHLDGGLLRQIVLVGKTPNDI